MFTCAEGQQRTDPEPCHTHRAAAEYHLRESAKPSSPWQGSTTPTQGREWWGSLQFGKFDLVFPWKYTTGQRHLRQWMESLFLCRRCLFTGCWSNSRWPRNDSMASKWRLDDILLSCLHLKSDCAYFSVVWTPQLLFVLTCCNHLNLRGERKETYPDRWEEQCSTLRSELQVISNRFAGWGSCSRKRNFLSLCRH